MKNQFQYHYNLCAPGPKSNLLYQVILTRWLMNVSDRAHLPPIYTLHSFQGLAMSSTRTTWTGFNFLEIYGRAAKEVKPVQISSFGTFLQTCQCCLGTCLPKPGRQEEQKNCCFPPLHFVILLLPFLDFGTCLNPVGWSQSWQPLPDLIYWFPLNQDLGGPAKGGWCVSGCI